jgi:hypothetical protein
MAWHGKSLVPLIVPLLRASAKCNVSEKGPRLSLEALTLRSFMWHTLDYSKSLLTVKVIRSILWISREYENINNRNELQGKRRYFWLTVRNYLAKKLNKVVSHYWQ